MENSIKKSKAKKNNVDVVEIVQSENKLNQNETVEGRVEYEIQKFEFSDSRIAEIKKEFEGLEIAGVDDKAGIKAVAEALSVVRNLRTGINKKREELKDFYLNTGRGIDAEAKRIQELIAEVEEPLKAKKTAIENEIQRLKDEEEEAQQKILDDKVDALKEAGIEFDGTFYSIGQSISVDLVSIKDLDEEAFARLVEMVKSEKKKIDDQKELQQLHENRKEELLPFWSFLTVEMQSENLSGLSNERFVEILFEVKSKKEEFDQIQANQKAEAEKQIQERKDLNFEKRSFKFEKEGFSVNEDGVSFVNESGNVLMSRNRIEELNNVEFDKEFELKIGIKKAYEKEVIQLAEQRKKDAEAEAERKVQESKQMEFNERLSSRQQILSSLGFKRENDGFLVNGGIRFDMKIIGEMNEVEFGEIISDATKAKAEKDIKDARILEEERLAKLPEIDKLKRYCEELLNVSAPELKTPEAVKEFNLLFGEVKRSVEKTLSNLIII